ncbi:MAG: putative 4-hydroxybenzoate polyprenyltransferase [Pirellulales bacterium]|nr:putative 4-hydroxybenzoate polyprenyltransferase [Pirellulales bacterium]
MLRQLLELIRFSHTVFALPFALLAALLAWAYRSASGISAGWRWSELLGVLLCMVFARSAAMAFNRAVDRELDARNPRTQGRHLPARTLTPAIVWVFFSVCVLGFVASTLLFLPNPWPALLSVPVLSFICGYSYAKRFTAAAHFWLGAALFLAPVCTWVAIVGFDNPLPAVVLGGAVLFWVAGFDIIYACQDERIDRQEGLHSVPVALGIPKALRLAAGCHLTTVVLLFVLPLCYTQPGLGWVYLAGVALVAGLLAYEHFIVRPDDLTRVNVAFFQVNAVVSIGLFAIGALDLSMK